MQRVLLAVLLRGRTLQIDKSYRILAPWRHLHFERFLEWLFWKRRETWRDMEMCLTLEDGTAFLEELRQRLETGDIGIRRRAGIGLRFSHSKAEERDYIWIEFVSDAPALIDEIVAMARRVSGSGVRFHRGKYVPRG